MFVKGTEMEVFMRILKNLSVKIKLLVPALLMVLCMIVMAVTNYFSFNSVMDASRKISSESSLRHL